MTRRVRTAKRPHIGAATRAAGARREVHRGKRVNFRRGSAWGPVGVRVSAVDVLAIVLWCLLLLLLLLLLPRVVVLLVVAIVVVMVVTRVVVHVRAMRVSTISTITQRSPSRNPTHLAALTRSLRALECRATRSAASRADLRRRRGERLAPCGCGVAGDRRDGRRAGGRTRRAGSPRRLRTSSGAAIRGHGDWSGCSQRVSVREGVRVSVVTAAVSDM